MDIPLRQQIQNFKYRLWNNEIDLLFISHFHEDHINGLGHLLSNCIVQNIVIPKMPQDFIICAMIQNALSRQGSPSSNANDILSSIQGAPSSAFSLPPILKTQYLNLIHYSLEQLS